MDDMLLADISEEIAEMKDARAIPTMIGVVDADNSGKTVWGVGRRLHALAEVRFSSYHDGAWWRAWWEGNKSRYAEEVQKIPIPDLPKTAHGRSYRPYEADLESFEGLAALMRDEIRKGKLGHLGLSEIAEAIAETGDPRAIPTLIGVIIADDTYDSTYGVGYFGLRHITDVSYDESHDGEWWRKWWERNKSRYAADGRAMGIPDFSKEVAEGRDKAKAARRVR